MNFDEINKKSWENVINKNVMVYPNERVVAFLARNYKNIEENASKRALDIGFGSGRHVKLLLDFNFNAYGIDYNQRCVDVANTMLGNDYRLKDLSVCDIKKCRFENAFFDVILAYGVLFLRKEEEMLEDLKKIANLMKINGKAIVNFRTKEDTLYKKGEQIQRNTYLLEERTGAYNNMVYTFLDIEEVRELFSKAGLTIEREEREDYYKDSLNEKHSWWIITVSKKNN